MLCSYQQEKKKDKIHKNKQSKWVSISITKQEQTISVSKDKAIGDKSKELNISSTLATTIRRYMAWSQAVLQNTAEITCKSQASINYSLCLNPRTESLTHHWNRNFTYLHFISAPGHPFYCCVDTDILVLPIFFTHLSVHSSSPLAHISAL